MDIKKMLGWKRGLPQKHAFQYAPHRGFMAQPTSVDLAPQCPPIWNQGSLGSCTAHAGAGLAEFIMRKLGKKYFMPARLAIYYWTRQAEGTASWDSGATLSETMKTLSRWGCPNETKWPYVIRKYKNKPTATVVADGANHRVAQGLAVNQRLVDFKSCLAEGWPFMFGFTVYSSFESNAVTKTGIMPMPKAGEQILGGHAVLAVGYDDTKQMFKIRNSWGMGWGQKGYFWMPYAFIVDNDYADDFWTAHDFTTWK